MAKKEIEPAGNTLTVTGSGSEGNQVIYVLDEPTAAELLEKAAALLEQQQGPRANKHYRQLAEQVRALADRI